MAVDKLVIRRDHMGEQLVIIGFVLWLFSQWREGKWDCLYFRRAGKWMMIFGGVLWFISNAIVLKIG